jgi:NADH:ubiquinone oxidoreductase subunit F (NADH-binding)
VPVPSVIDIAPGPALLADIDGNGDLAGHRRRYPAPRAVDVGQLVDLTRRTGLRGRGGAAFPFATKLEAAASGRRPTVVVNAGEGEPASAKDSALALSRPHLVLDGAVATARALGSREVHVVLPGERPHVAQRLRAAIAERDEGLRVRTHVADNRFVAGQARAVLELMAGRPGLPVTAWQPEAVHGHRGHPTLLSNAETWAQVGHLLGRGEEEYRRFGTRREPGTTLLTLGVRDRRPVVREVEYGVRLRDALPEGAYGRPALLGGFHGSWVSWTTLASLRVSVAGLRALGTPLGAGVVFTPGEHECPVRLTSRIVDYLAGQSARRCGPCLNGLPALAAALGAVADGTGGTRRVTELAGLVERRGACAHPDGTVRLVRSLLAALPDEVDVHLEGGCGLARRGSPGPARRLRAVPDREEAS